MRHTICELVTGVQTCALPIFLSMFLSPIGHTPSETCRQVPAFSSSTLTPVPDSARQAALDPSRQTIASMPLSSRTISQPKENLRIIDLPIHKGIGVKIGRAHV